MDLAFSQLKNTSSDLTTSANYAHISQEWLEAAREAGGDALDLDPAQGGIFGEKPQHRNEYH